MNRLIVHIGLAKTATTALQGFLFDNRAALAERHILFPKTMALRTSGHFHFAHALIGTSRASSAMGTLADLMAEIENTEDDAILSAETLSTFSSRHPVPQRLAEFAGRLGRRATILVYLRDQASLAESLYGQRVMAGLITDDFDEYISKCLESPLFDYARLLDRWNEYFDDIVVRRFPPGDEISIERDFLTAAGTIIDPGELPHPLIRRNTRMSARMVEYLRQFSIMLHGNRIPSLRRRRLLRHMVDGFSRMRDASGPFRGLTPEMIERIKDRFAEGNAQVARRFAEDEILFPSDPGQGPPPVNVVAIDTPTERRRFKSAVARSKRAVREASAAKR